MNIKDRKSILIIILVSYFVILLDNSIIFTGTVKIARDLNLTQSHLSWVSNAYAITFGGFLLLGGKLGDLLNRKNVFLIGLMIFGIASLAVGLSQSGLMLIFSRAVQGIGSAILAPATLALILDNFEGRARNKVIGYYGATAGIGASIGLVIGGFFAQVLSWRYGFYINLPVTLLLMFLTIKYLPNNSREKGKIDFIGAITSVISMTLLTYSLVGENYRLIAFVLSLLIFIYFIYIESKLNYALMPLELFKDKTRIAGYAGRFFYMCAMFSFWFLTPQIMQKLLGFSPLQAGLGFIPLTIINFIVALKAVDLAEKFGLKKVLLTGVLLTVFGMGYMIFFNDMLGYWLGISIPMCFLGVGQGLVMSLITSVGVSNTKGPLSGAASGVINTLHQLGGSLGLAVVIAIASQSKSFIGYYHIAMIITTIFLIISFTLCFILIKKTQLGK